MHQKGEFQGRTWNSCNARSTRYSATLGSIKRLKQSGKWKGQTKLSKHGSGRVRRILYLAALRSIHQEHPLWGFLSAFDGSGDEKGHGWSGSHAQNGECRCPFDPDAEEVRSGKVALPAWRPHPQRLRQQSLWTMFRGQGTVECGIAWTRGLDKFYDLLLFRE
jgi:Transposase IS116/IS110/IS902 family